MKNLLPILFILFVSQLATAQTAGLQIDNTTNPCGVYIEMVAYDFAAGDPNCSIQANQIYVGPYGTASFADYYAVQSAVGWLTIPSGPYPPTPPYSQLTWEEAKFQFNCTGILPMPPCANGGAYVNGGPTATFICSGTTGALTWIGPCQTVTWSPAGSIPLANVKIKVTYP